MGFGYDDSEYNESKRAVEDDDLGPLIATEMTRCIHCTRCVRFGEEIAGVRELGATGRGEKVQIGTYIKHSITSEVSGNVIDLCPVGALTSKPYRFTARAWELSQHDSISPHDCLGTNIHLHVRRNTLMRVVPKENESINETWIADRDRYSYLGITSKARAAQPMIKKEGQWQTVDWPTALKFVADGVSKIIKQHGAEQFAAFSSPSATLEEMYLLQKLMRELGVQNLDHRVHQTDFADQHNLPVIDKNSIKYSEIESQSTIFLVGCNIDREIPLAGLRTRKAFKNGSKIYALNPVKYDYNFEVQNHIVVSPLELPMHLATILLAMTDNATKFPEEIQRLLIGLTPQDSHKEIAKALMQPNALIITGAISENHPNASLIRTLINAICDYALTKRLSFTSGANSAGAMLAGMLPHRTAAGKIVESPGMDVQSALTAKLKGYFLHAVDPAFDFENPSRARQSMLAAEFVVMLSPFNTEAMRDYADVILPIAPFSETSGTYINIDNYWQTVKGAYTPFGEARPAWKVMRVLANLLQCKGFEYTSSEEVLSEIKSLANMMAPTRYKPHYPESLPVIDQQLVRVGEWPLYRSDAIVRNSEALQTCAAAEQVCIRIHPETANRLKLDDFATVSQGDIEITLPLKRDERIAQDVVWVANAMPETIDLGHSFAAITIKR